MTNDEIRTFEKRVKALVARCTCLDPHAQQGIVNEVIAIYIRRNRYDRFVKSYIKKIIAEVRRNEGEMQYLVSREVSDSEDGVRVEEIYQARTKKQQAHDEAEIVDIDECYDVAALNTHTNAKIRLFESMSNTASLLMRSVISRICAGEDEDEVAISCGFKDWVQLLYRLRREANHDLEQNDSGQICFTF